MKTDAMERTSNLGAIQALASAFLFGVSPVISKLIMGEMSPIFLAGLLYLGSGLGLQVLLIVRKGKPFHELRQIKKEHRLKLLGAVLTGGVLAPICLVSGIQASTAFEVSALLNFESVTSTLIAWWVFKEHVGQRVFLGKALVILGAVILSVDWTQGSFRFSSGSIWVVAACIFWGIDNNLTRDVDELSPSVLAWAKGVVSGVINLTLAWLLGQAQGNTLQILGGLGIGGLSYGASLVLFVKALRSIGTSRTSTYFASGPFFGMLGSILFLSDQPGPAQWFSSALMAAGIGVVYFEFHSHLHTHERITHRHKHVHDEHHQHQHDGTEGQKPHSHVHTHEPLVHSHAHWPDIHHRHSH